MLFTLYLVIGTYLITRISFIRKTGLSPKIIAGLFLLKIFAGIAIGWITQKFYPGNDYWGLNQDGLVEYQLLVHDPREFFLNIFRSHYENGYSGFFNSIGSYWNDLRYNIIIKLLAVCDIFSRGNFYINSLLFNFFGFFGAVALFRVFSDIYKDRKWAILAGCFLVPSTLYFSSGIHKELIVYTMLGLFCYGLYFSMVQKFNFKRSLLIFFSFTAILLIRNFVAIALIPGSLAFIWSIKKRINPLVTFIATYAVFFLMIFTLPFLIPSFQPLKIITQKQADFSDIPTATSQLNMNVLEPNLKSFVHDMPQAIDHGFLRPYIWERSKTFLFPFALELLITEFLFLTFILKYRKGIASPHAFTLLAIFFSISMLLITGFIVPNMGSIVRYRSIYLPFFLTPLLCSIFYKNQKLQ